MWDGNHAVLKRAVSSLLMSHFIEGGYFFGRNGTNIMNDLMDALAVAKMGYLYPK
jgi:hypothetical protein